MEKEKRKKKKVSKQQINLHMSTYKTHDLFNNSRTRICSSNAKNKIINKNIVGFSVPGHSSFVVWLKCKKLKGNSIFYFLRKEIHYFSVTALNTMGTVSLG